MFESEAERARVTAEDLIRVLSAYDDELGDLAQNLPGVVALREAVGAALAQACRCILDRDAGIGGPGRTTH
jgi:archaellum biogenesis protein FlaJ (TadC family)